MDINPLVNILVEEIAQDAEIETWCQKEYGRSIQVFRNYDMRKPPTAEQCPCVCIYPSEKQYGGQNYQDAIECVCQVYDERTRSHADMPNIIDYTGVENVEDLRKLVLAAMARVIEGTDASRIDSVSVDYDTITEFPFVTAAQAAAIVTPYLIGSGNPVTNE